MTRDGITDQMFDGDHGLLWYDAKFRVLICQECKYAIQKSAIESHLLRHKIYRGKRQRLLSSVSKLDISEPDNVHSPPVGSSPIKGLSLLSGYKCTKHNCGYLCASSKRMRRHWSETHGITDPPISFSSSVNIQTFFKGTKIRYFEVCSSAAPSDEGPTVAEGELSEQRHHTESTALSRSDSASLVDLKTLGYFHHFTSNTIFTFPVCETEREDYWNSVVVGEALQLHWLMCGLLSVTISHVASCSKDDVTWNIHHEASKKFHRKFSAGFTELKNDTRVKPTTATKLGAQLFCIQKCLSNTSLLGPGNNVIFQSLNLYEFTSAIRGCADPEYAYISVCNSASSSQQQPFRLGCIEDEGRGSIRVLSNVPGQLVDTLRELPFQMAEVLGKPDDAQDVLATLSAIDNLVTCLSLSYASETPYAAWKGMESWLNYTSVRFELMVRQETIAALIVVAHWAPLIKRAEHHYWFLKGSADILLQYIRNKASRNNSLVKILETVIV